MANFKSKLQALKESTTSPEVKQLCEQILNTLKSQPYLVKINEGSVLVDPDTYLKKMVLEGLSTVAGDSYSEDLINRVKNDVESNKLGLSEAYEALKFNVIADPHYNYLVKAFENHVNSEVPDYMVIGQVIESFKNFKFDPKVKEVITKIEETADQFKTEISLKKVLFDIKSSPNAFMFEALQNQIQEYIETKKGKEMLMAELMRLNYPSLQEAIRVLASASINEGALQFVNTNSNCTVEGIVSPVLFESDSQIFTDKINFYKHNKNGVTRLETVDIQALPKTYLSLVEAFMNPSMKFSNSDVTAILGKNRIKLSIEDGKFFLNEKETTLEAIVKVGLFENQHKAVNDLALIAENKDLFFDMDFAKKITSNVFENAAVTVISSGDKLFANKLNGGMNENKFEEFSATNLNEMVKGFLNFEMNEGLEAFLTVEKAEVKKFNDEQFEIKESILDLNTKLKTIQETKVKNPDFTAIIEQAEKVISEEIETLQMEWNDLEEKKTHFLKLKKQLIKEDELVSSGFNIGDKVKVNGTNLIGEITGINSNDQMIDVLHSDGTTKSYTVSQIKSKEDDSDAAEKKNDEEGEKTEDEQEAKGNKE